MDIEWLKRIKTLSTTFQFPVGLTNPIAMAFPYLTGPASQRALEGLRELVDLSLKKSGAVFVARGDASVAADRARELPVFRTVTAVYQDPKTKKLSLIFQNDEDIHNDAMANSRIKLPSKSSIDLGLDDDSLCISSSF